MCALLHQKTGGIGSWASAQVVALSLFITGSADAGETSHTQEGWQAVAQVQFHNARRAFEARLEADPNDHEAGIGLATALLNVQPRQPGNVERAAALLEGVRGAAAGDGAWIEATYLSARIHQVHRAAADPARAIQLYDELLTAHPQHPLAQMGFVKSAMLRLYVLNEAPPAETFLALEERGATLTDPAARRDFHLMMAAAASRLELGAALALRHLQEADAVGVSKRKTAGDLYVRIATLARTLGQPNLAETYERRFINEFPRDSRAFTLRQRLTTPTTQPNEPTP
jgi:thioredoxin-like negative regulator of GroEL